MATVDYGRGEREIRCTYHTLTVYEQEFHSDTCDNVTGDLIRDLFGRIVVATDDGSLGYTTDEDGNVTSLVVDYTRDDWNVERRALWAMLRTADDIARVHGTERVEPVPSFREWDASLLECEPDLRAVATAVMDEAQRGLFRAGAAASGKTSDGE